MGGGVMQLVAYGAVAPYPYGLVGRLGIPYNYMKNPYTKLEYGILDNIKEENEKMLEPQLIASLKACTYIDFDSEQLSILGTNFNKSRLQYQIEMERKK